MHILGPPNAFLARCSHPHGKAIGVFDLARAVGAGDHPPADPTEVSHAWAVESCMHSDAAKYSLYGESLTKYTKRHLHDSTAHGLTEVARVADELRSYFAVHPMPAPNPSAPKL